MANSKRFIPKSKVITYTGAFIKRYNWKNSGQVYKIHGMIELEKMHALIVKNLHNLGANRIIEILSVIHSTHIVPKKQDKFLFYVNNYINWNQFNQL